MILFYCITAAGAVLIAKNKCDRNIREIKHPSLAEIERRLDAENEALDREIDELLLKHRNLCRGS